MQTLEEAHNAPPLQVLPRPLDFTFWTHQRPPYPPRLQFGFLLSTKDLYDLLVTELDYPRAKKFNKRWPAWEGRACQNIVHYIALQIGHGLELKYVQVIHEEKIYWCLSINDSYNRLDTKPMRIAALLLQRWFAKKGIVLESAMWYMDFDDTYCF